MQQREKSHSHRSATQRRSPAKVQYALDLEAAMAALEVKLNVSAPRNSVLAKPSLPVRKSFHGVAVYF